MILSNNEIAKMMDISCVRANNTLSEIEEAAKVAKKYSCICVYALPAHTPLFVELLSDRSDILIGGAVGFPSGGMTTSMKVDETKELLQMGVNEIDMVINVNWLKSGRLENVRDDIQAVRDATADIPLKIILECDYLTDDEITIGSEIGVKCGVEWIKTGTGWAPNGTTAHQVELIAKAVGDDCQIKAAGGIKDKETLLHMYDLGVRRFGIGYKVAREILGK